MGQKGYGEPQNLETCQLASSGSLEHLSALELTFSHHCSVLLLAAALRRVVLRESRQAVTRGLDFCRRVLLSLANADCLPWLQPALGLFSLEWVF